MFVSLGVSHLENGNEYGREMDRGTYDVMINDVFLEWVGFWNRTVVWAGLSKGKIGVLGLGVSDARGCHDTYLLIILWCNDIISLITIFSHPKYVHVNRHPLCIHPIFPCD